MSDLEKRLLENLNVFLAFVRRRVSDPELAADVLQESLLKALERSEQLRDEDALVPWFYRILRSAITDMYRHRAVEERRLGQLKLVTKASLAEDPSTHAVVCQCFRRLLPTMRPEYAKLIEELELSDGSTVEIAKRLGITLNNLKVRRHRARAQLRKRLEETCRLCATHGCLDCTCGH